MSSPGIVHEGLTYAEIQGFRPLLLDLHIPATASPENPVPLVVWMHGGAFWAGDRRHLPSNLAPNAVFDTLVAAGIAAATIDYRLSGEARFPAQLDDVRTAVRYLRSNAARWGIDATRVGVWGESAGGTLGALAALAPADTANDDDASGASDGSGVSNVSSVSSVSDADPPLAAAALWCSPTDLVPLRHFSAIAAFLGGTGEEFEAVAAQASPTTHVRRDAPPFLIMHGDADRTCPVQQAEALHEALLAAGARSELALVEGADHVFKGHPDAQRLVEQVVAFFSRELAPTVP
ncbi:alpha/beta hydrolase [Catenulispora sp. NF23]|uniref:alpha/beta hydrolase n=1 Tax=Catenulispora pinistramenti TaxID=2705254 RepID=UPI001BA4C1FF|nr:alpha/beta hydrolase [Catenulispora pinistramenti]MBS2533785.1 alpha/beta hydrolase [Catenulispora pinistramenti]